MAQEGWEVGERMKTISTSRKFEAAHRQYGDPGKCGYLHGHNWQVDITLTGTPDTVIGYVVDFKTIFDIIDEFDHKTLLRYDDPLVEVLSDHNQRLIVLSVNATCENLAGLFANRIEAMLGKLRMHITYLKVVVWENDHSNAFDERHYSKVVQ